MIDTDIETDRTGRVRRPLIVSATMFVVLLASSLGIFVVAEHANRPPSPFPESPFIVEEGDTLRRIALNLKAGGYIRSETLFRTIAVVNGQAEQLHAGTYLFDRPLSTSELIVSLATGEHSKNSVVLTIPEGTRVSLIADIASQVLPSFDRDRFIDIAAKDEGYLFPDTYFVSPETTPEELYALLRSTFNEKVKLHIGTTTPDVVILASILEREGNAPENMRLIAGILNNRLAIDMPLQVDATLEYERGLGSAELSIDDLETDSPYNTYTRRGLPPTPIANPGLAAITAAINPEKTEYLYYLTGNDGVFYYATTFEEHKRNKERYLRD